MPKLQVHTRFTLRLGDDSATTYDKGVHDFDALVADHWYVKLHTNEAPQEIGASAVSAGDTQAIEELADELAAEGKRLAALKAELANLAADLEARSASLDAREQSISEREANLAEKNTAEDAQSADSQAPEARNPGRPKKG